jgi:hypothetical protein
MMSDGNWNNSSCSNETITTDTSPMSVTPTSAKPITLWTADSSSPSGVDPLKSSTLISFPSNLTAQTGDGLSSNMWATESVYPTKGFFIDSY